MVNLKCTYCSNETDIPNRPFVTKKLCTDCWDSKLTYAFVRREYELTCQEFPESITYKKPYYYMPQDVDKVYQDKRNKLRRDAIARKTDDPKQKDWLKAEKFHKKRLRKLEIEKFYKDNNISDRIFEKLDKTMAQKYINGYIKSLDDVKTILLEKINETTNIINHQDNIDKAIKTFDCDVRFEKDLFDQIIECHKIKGSSDEIYKTAYNFMKEYRTLMDSLMDTRKERAEELSLLDSACVFNAQLYIRGGQQLLTIITNGRLLSAQDVIDDISK